LARRHPNGESEGILEHLHHGGPQSLVGNPVPRDGSEPRPSARILRKRGSDHGSVCEEDSLRQDLEGRLAGGGWWLEVRWGGGISL
jgi:hypothetical protein